MSDISAEMDCLAAAVSLCWLTVLVTVIVRKGVHMRHAAQKEAISVLTKQAAAPSYTAMVSVGERNVVNLHHGRWFLNLERL